MLLLFFKEKKGINLFSGILYINLDHRTDRKKQILNQFTLLQAEMKKVHRVQGCPDPLNGHRGAIKSHIRAIEIAKENRWKNVLILEDDFMPTRSIKYFDEIIRYFFTTVQNAWDVFFLGGEIQSYEKTKYPRVFRSLQSICAHGYAIHQDYYDVLLDCYLSSYESLKKIPLFLDVENYALDRAWQRLQMIHRWYFIEIISQQAESFSDIDLAYKHRESREIFH